MSRKTKRRESPNNAPATAAPLATPRRIWQAIRPEWIAATVVLVVTAWMVTQGDWDFFGVTGRLEGFYEAQAQSLLQGRIDVPPEAISDEAFVRNGKNYGYFGPTPAVFRIPLVVLAPGMNGKWSRLSMLAGTAAMLGALLLLLWRLEEMLPGLARSRVWPRLRVLLVLAAGLGSTQIFVCAESKVYQESIEWAASLSLLSAACLLSYLNTGARRWLAAGCVTAFLSFFARVSSGAGPIFALFLLDAALLLPDVRLRKAVGVPDGAGARQAAVMLTATIAITASLWAGLNYWKFGTWFASQPLAMNLQYTPERLAYVEGDLASLNNLPLTLANYLSPARVRFSGGFPWIWTVHPSRAEVAARFPAAHFDYSDWFASLPAGMPALFFAAIAGTALCFRGRQTELRTLRTPLCGAIAGCGLAFLWGLLAYRYLHDTFPWLVIGAAIAASYMSLSPRRGLTTVFGLAVVYSMWANVAFAVTQQRIRTTPVPVERRLAYIDLLEMSARDGFQGLLSYTAHSRTYVPAVNAIEVRGLARAPDEIDHSVVNVRSDGPPPHAGLYEIEVKREGAYRLSVRCGSVEVQPIAVFLNGQFAGQTCTLATGGTVEKYQTWFPVATARLAAGKLRVQLVSDKPWPLVSCLRMVALD